MFKPKTKRIEKLAEIFTKTISELEKVFDRPTNIYIDWQNVIHWQEKLGWHVSSKRFKQLLDSFDTVQKVHLYTGILDSNAKSVQEKEELEAMGYSVHTKSVKIMPHSIDTSSIKANSPTLLEPFIKKPLLSALNVETIEYLNRQLTNLNKQGIKVLEDMKCNFDVEMGRDIFLDLERNSVECFVVLSGDSDFVDPIQAIADQAKQSYIFATSGRVSSELSEMNVPIFEIKKVREFICWPKELSNSITTKISEP